MRPSAAPAPCGPRSTRASSRSSGNAVGHAQGSAGRGGDRRCRHDDLPDPLGPISPSVSPCAPDNDTSGTMILRPIPHPGSRPGRGRSRRRCGRGRRSPCTGCPSIVRGYVVASACAAAQANATVSPLSARRSCSTYPHLFPIKKGWFFLSGCDLKIKGSDTGESGIRRQAFFGHLYSPVRRMWPSRGAKYAP